MDDLKHAAKVKWILDVLGIIIPLTADATQDPSSVDVSPFKVSWEKAVAGWQVATEQVDAQILRLRQTLYGMDDEALHQVADFQMDDFIESRDMPLLTVLQDVAGAPRDRLKQSADAARARIMACTKHVQSDPRIAACDKNPFGAPIYIRSTLIPALELLSATLNDAQ